MQYFGHHAHCVHTLLKLIYSRLLKWMHNYKSLNALHWIQCVSYTAASAWRLTDSWVYAAAKPPLIRSQSSCARTAPLFQVCKLPNLCLYHAHRSPKILEPTELRGWRIDPWRGLASRRVVHHPRERSVMMRISVAGSRWIWCVTTLPFFLGGEKAMGSGAVDSSQWLSVKEETIFLHDGLIRVTDLAELPSEIGVSEQGESEQEVCVYYIPLI